MALEFQGPSVVEIYLDTIAWLIAGLTLSSVVARRNLIHFSFVTLTTTDYGDISPVHPYARSLASIEAIIGQLYPVEGSTRGLATAAQLRNRRL